MLPYSRGLMLDNTNNYGIVKTEAVFGFGPPNRSNYANDSFNTTEPLNGWNQWIISSNNFGRRSLEDESVSSRSLKSKPKKSLKSSSKPKSNQSKESIHANKKKKRKSKGVKKCIFKILKKGEGGSSGKKRRRTKFPKVSKKLMLPVILGLLAAKSILIPIALKALAFLSAKGLMMAFFSTVMASIISLKGMFDHSHGYQNRKDDNGKTQVEIIQVPTKSEDHIYYDDHYRRGDLIPILPIPEK